MSINDFMNTDIEIVMFGPEAQMFGPEAHVGPGGAADSSGGTCVICTHHHLVNKNYQQELGCVRCDWPAWWRNS